MENWILLGASRGLGRAFLEKARQKNQSTSSFQLTACARKTDQIPPDVQTLSMDFSKKDQWEEIIQKIRQKNPQQIFYFAGGGPYGKVQDKNWKDHQWAMNVTFEFPAYLLHSFLREPQTVRRMVFIGSAIAESQPDAFASSYCAAKHALKGFITSIQAEQQTSFEVKLFSPGYIDTDLLPAHAWPRQQEGLVHSAENVAQKLWDNLHNADGLSEHFVLKSQT